MNNDAPPPIPPRPPGWVSSPLSSPGSGPWPSSPSNEAPPPPLPPRRPTTEEHPPVHLERQPRPYSYVAPSRESSGQSPPLPPRVTRRPVPQREPEPRAQASPATPASSSSQSSKSLFAAQLFEQFGQQEFQAPTFDFNPPNPFQPQAAETAYEATPADFDAFKTQYTPPDLEALKAQAEAQQQTFPPPPSFPPPPFGPAPSTSSSSPYSASNPPPPSPPSSGSSPSPIPYDKWTPLFQPDGTPNFIFIALIKSFFEVLVAQQTPEMRPGNGTGAHEMGQGAAVNGQKLLSPEKCSEFLDVQGFAVEHNTWKLNKTPWSSSISVPGLPNPLAALTPLDKADWEFRLILQAFGIHHIPISRPRAPHSQRPQQVQARPFIPSWLTNLMAVQAQEIPEGMRVLGVGQTPFLTEQGFIKYMAIETAGEPDRGFEGLNAALRYYGGGSNGGASGMGMGMGMGMEGWWRKLGPIPRDMFPATCPKEIQTAVDIGQAKHRDLCQDAVAGSRAYAQMAAEGRRHALELVSDDRYVRVDQYGNRIY
ncbi:hypothetical protein QBC45DRAFT_328193 [Copromyces sp. CBS 386.78]|nr:hypothetical protein QBC45DRAFT_328193 [Copromyces sp. CBS 386.78]